MLPNGEFVRPDILCSALRTVKQKNFNINKPNDPSFYEAKLKLLFYQLRLVLNQKIIKISFNFLGRSVIKNNRFVKI